MKKRARQDGVALITLWKMFLKNVFSVFYFMIVGLILAVIYTQFLVKPSFIATGNIENVGAVNTALMQTMPMIAKEQQTLEKVVEKMNVPVVEQAKKIEEINTKLVVNNYSATTLKVTISYKSTAKNEAELVVNCVIEVSIERFIERNPALEDKVKKQSNPIVARPTGLSNRAIYIGFIGLGVVFGAVVGIAGDLINRHILFAEDLKEYGVPCNVINLNQKKGDVIPPLETEEFLKGTIVLQDQLEGVIRDKKARVIGVANLGYDTYEVLSAVLAENLSKVGLKTLVIDLDLEHPRIHAFYNVDTAINITNILNDEVIKPLKIKNNLEVLPTTTYAYPAHFLKDERLHKLIRENALKYDYVFVNIPIVDYYAPILFNFDLIDMLLINTSFEGTKMKKLDAYIENLEIEHRSKLFLNGIDSRAKRDFTKIKEKIKALFKRKNKKDE